MAMVLEVDPGGWWCYFINSGKVLWGRKPEAVQKPSAHSLLLRGGGWTPGTQIASLMDGRSGLVVDRQHKSSVTLLLEWSIPENRPGVGKVFWCSVASCVPLMLPGDGENFEDSARG